MSQQNLAPSLPRGTSRLGQDSNALAELGLSWDLRVPAWNLEEDADVAREHWRPRDRVEPHRVAVGPRLGGPTDVAEGSTGFDLSNGVDVRNPLDPQARRVSLEALPVARRAEADLRPALGRHRCTCWPLGTPGCRRRRLRCSRPARARSCTASRRPNW